MKDLQLVAIDLDRTLLRMDKTFDADRFNEVAHDLSRKGVLFAIISGHNHQDTKTYLKSMNTEGMYISSHNGNRIVYQNEVLQQIKIPDSKVRDILERLDIIKEYSVLLDDGDNIYIYKLEAHHQKEIIDYYPQAKRGAEDLVQSEKDLLKIAVYTDKDRPALLKAADDLQELLPIIDVVPRFQRWLEFHQQSGGKGAVLAAIQKKHGIKPSKTLTFGNKSNDLSMNRYADYTLAMGNGTEEYKNSSSHVIGTNEEQAVIQILEKVNRTESLDALKKYKK